MNEKGFMPDLPISEQIIEQRKVIKFWIDHCAALEKDRDKWKEVAWLGYKVMYENWEPTQFHSAYMDAMTENGEL